MEEEYVTYYVKAGEIAFRVKDYVRRYVKPGMKLVDIANSVESLIRDLGGEPAFPLNISINYVAAHRTALADDPEVIPEDSVVKVDIGVHVNGYIADTAITLVFNDKYLEMAEVNKEALYRALRSLKPGMRFSDLGGIIEGIVRRRRFKVIKNLTGHSLGRYLIHAGEVVPNYRDPLALGRFRVGRAYAIEPFVTNGKGYVREVRTEIQIYALKSHDISAKELSNDEALLISYIKERFRTLPFCERWLVSVISDLGRLRRLLESLSSKGFLFKYPVLVEAGKGFVTQFEETVLLTTEGVLVTTNPEIKP